MGKKQAATTKAYLADGTEVEVLATKALVLHEDGTEGEAWVTSEAPKEETNDGQDQAAG